MAKKENKAYSRYCSEALKLLSRHIRVTRIERGITTQELAERAGISRGLLRRIENGDPGCSIGAVFEVAAILGVPLFNADQKALTAENIRICNKLSLLPSEVRKRRLEINDDF